MLVVLAVLCVMCCLGFVSAHYIIFWGCVRLLKLYFKIPWYIFYLIYILDSFMGTGIVVGMMQNPPRAESAYVPYQPGISYFDWICLHIWLSYDDMLRYCKEIGLHVIYRGEYYQGIEIIEYVDTFHLFPRKDWAFIRQPGGGQGPRYTLWRGN